MSGSQVKQRPSGRAMLAAASAAVVVLLCCAGPALITVGVLGVICATLRNPWVLAADGVILLGAGLVAMRRRRHHHTERRPSITRNGDHDAFCRLPHRGAR